MSGSEIRVDLEERFDKDGKRYLFGSIPFLNMVMFVREHYGRTHASLRPYRPKSVDGNDEPGRKT